MISTPGLQQFLNEENEAEKHLVWGYPTNKQN